MTTSAAWFHIENEAEIASPALLLYKERIEYNLQLMLEIAGGLSFLLTMLAFFVIEARKRRRGPLA